MNLDKKSIFIWSPFVNKVGTVQNVINSILSINRYSKLNTNLINVFGEWDEYLNLLKKKKIYVHNFKFLKIIKNWNKSGFFKSRISYIIIYFISFFQFLNLIKKQKPNFIIVHLISSLPLTVFSLFNLKTKLILHIAGHPRLNLLRKITWRISSPNIYKVICPSKELKVFLLKNNIFKNNQIEVIEDPHIEIKKINNIKKESLKDNFFDTGNILIAIGRLTKQKNYSFLIKNFKRILTKYPNTKLIIIGEGEERNYLLKLIYDLKISNVVKIINHKSNIYKYLKRSNFYISTSNWEGSSLAMIDAAFIGIPILCSDCPSGRKEFIGNNQRGFLYEKNNSEDFIKSYHNLYNLKSNQINKIIISAKKQTINFTLFRYYLKLSKILN
jgi:glycosyltransferase involved in cell wall biosynthesis